MQVFGIHVSGSVTLKTPKSFKKKKRKIKNTPHKDGKSKQIISW